MNSGHPRGPSAWRIAVMAVGVVALLVEPFPIPVGGAFGVVQASDWIPPLVSPALGDIQYRDYLSAVRVTERTSATATVEVSYAYPGTPPGPVEISVVPNTDSGPVPSAPCFQGMGWDGARITASTGIVAIPVVAMFGADCQAGFSVSSTRLWICMAPVGVPDPFVCRAYPYARTWRPEGAAPSVSSHPADIPFTGGKLTITGTGLSGATVSLTVDSATHRLTGLPESTDTALAVVVPPMKPRATSTPITFTVTTGTGATATGTITYRGVAVVLLQGLTTSWPPGAEPDTFWQADGLATRLRSHYGWPAAALQNFSYSNSATARFGTAYTACNTLDHLSTSVARLDAQLKAYAASHKEIDVYLVGHSQGGMVAFGYLAWLSKTGRNPARPFPGTQIAGVVTLDSPLGGVTLPPLLVEVTQAFFLSKCLSAGLLAHAFADLLWLGAQDENLRGWPWGGSGSVPKLLGMTSPASNQALAASGAGAGVRVLTIGNQLDWFMKPTGLGSTQWVADGGDGSGVYSRAISQPETCKFPDVLCYFNHNHGVVLTDTSVHGAILDLMLGRTPSLSAPQSPLDSAVSATWDVAGGILSAANGLVSLAAPAGSVAAPGPVSLTSVPAASITDPIPTGQALAGPAVSVTMPPLVAGASATLTLPVDLSVLQLSSTAAIFRDGEWVRMPTTIDLRTGTATATITEGGVYAPLSVPLAKVALADAIGAGIRRGSTGFTTGTVTVPVGGWVTYKVTTKPRLAGKGLVIWSRVGTGAWRKLTTRTVVSDGTVRYYAKVRSRTTFRATWLGDGTTAAATSPGRIVRTR